MSFMVAIYTNITKVELGGSWDYARLQLLPQDLYIYTGNTALICIYVAK